MTYIPMSEAKQLQIKAGNCPRCHESGRMILLAKRVTRLHVMRDVYCTHCTHRVEVPVYLIVLWRERDRERARERSTQKEIDRIAQDIEEETKCTAKNS